MPHRPILLGLLLVALTTVAVLIVARPPGGAADFERQYDLIAP